MRYVNADGNESTLCGNGTRCVVKFAYKQGIISESCVVETSVGLIPASVEGDEINIKMPSPQGFQQMDPENFWVNTGSPHYVQYLENDLENWDVNTEGKNYATTLPLKV